MMNDKTPSTFENHYVNASLLEMSFESTTSSGELNEK